jgi:hypothetical protein
MKNNDWARRLAYVSERNSPRWLDPIPYARSGSASYVTKALSPQYLNSGHIRCYLNRTNHILTTVIDSRKVAALVSLGYTR